MSKVVLVAVNAKYIHSSLAVWVLASSVSKYARMKHDVGVVEATIHQPDSGIADNVAAFAPDVVGVSTYIWNASKLSGLLKLLRERLPDAVLVLGGPEASHNAEYWLARGADYVLRGECEQSFPALLDELEVRGASMAELENGDSNSPTQGVRQDPTTSEIRNPLSGDVHGEGQGANNSPTQGAFPCFPGEEYIAALGGRIAYLETSRGCPFKCAFCLSAGSGVRYSPLKAAKEQIDILSKSGARTIKLVDRTFNCDAGRAYELLDYVIGLDTTCCFHFEVAADLFDGRTLSLLRSAPPGRIQFEAGLQSFYEPALSAASRKANLEVAERNIRALLEGRNIHIHVDLIAGLPYETLPDFMDSFDRAYGLGAHTLQLGFLKLLHGSTLRQRAGTLGIRYCDDPPYEIQSSPWLSTGDIKALKQTEDALRHTRNKCRFLSTLEYVLQASKLRPFSLFRMLGETAPNSGTQLEGYAAQVYDFCAGLPGVDEPQLRDRMVFDWLGMVKGRNTPGILKSNGNRQGQAAAAAAAAAAEKHLRRKPGRGEFAVLRSGAAAFVDSENRDPVTGLYRVHIAEL